MNDGFKSDFLGVTKRQCHSQTIGQTAQVGDGLSGILDAIPLRT
jgi:hypothetical protein